MLTFDPEFLAQACGGIWTQVPSLPVNGFTIDSRQVGAGQVFVALKTERRDGHDFVDAAQRAGAAAALVARALPGCSLPQLVVGDTLAAFQAIAREHRRRFTRPVVGISGSAGKTSTKNLLALLLGGESTVLATEGNLNNHLGVPLTLTRLDPARHRFAVIEAGISQPGDMTPLASMIEPDVAIITLVAPAHVEALGSIDGVAREKALLPGAVRAAGVAVFPKACLDYSAFRDLKVRTLVIEPAAVVRPQDGAEDKVYFAISHREQKTSLSLVYKDAEPRMFTLRRVTDGMAQNAVLAITVALWLGVTPEVIQAQLSTWAPATLRGELQQEGERWLYLDCYNANPASMADALAAFYQMAPATERRLFLLGGMEELGEHAAKYHRALGRMLHLRAGDLCYVIGGEAEEVRAGILENGNNGAQVFVIQQVEEARAMIAQFRGAVFVKGSRKYRLEKAVPGLSDFDGHGAATVLPTPPAVEPKVRTPGVMIC